jgi:Synergist-CTERM protein sorting domain-containing protein
MRGEDAPMTDYVLPHTTDGKNTSYEGLYTGYLVHLVTYERRGGPAGYGMATYLNEEPLPKPPGGGGCSTAGGFGLLFLFLLLPALRRRS